MPKYVLTDAEVKLTGYLSEKKYPESFRLIRYYDEEGDREFTFHACNKDDVITREEAQAPVISFDVNTGVYTAKVGRW